MTTTQIQLALLGVLVLFQLADWYTTRTILARGGVELNPVIRKLMDLIGVEPALIAKGAVVVGFAVWAELTDATLAMIAVYVVVIINNVRVMRRLVKQAARAKGA